MKSRSLISISLMAVAAFFTADKPAFAKETITPICAGCHQTDNSTIWGTLVPGSQTDEFFRVQAGKDIWSVRYDKKSSKLNKLANAKDLADEKAVRIKFKADTVDRVFAEEVSYKSNYGFKNPADVITISEVVELLKKSPEEGNYVIFDSRGYDNYIEGHLPGAVLLPHYQFNEFKDRMPADKNTLIVSYCRGYT
jgi:hypothetical protein